MPIGIYTLLKKITTENYFYKIGIYTQLKNITTPIGLKYSLFFFATEKYFYINWSKLL